MENQPKKSKALILAIIIILLLFVVGYILIKNNGGVSTKFSNFISKFNPLPVSPNSKELIPIEGGVCENSAINPPLCTVGANDKCLNGNTNPPGCNDGIIGICENGAINPPLCTVGANDKCLNGNTNPPGCNDGIIGICENGAINPPLCTVGANDKCLNGNTNPPGCYEESREEGDDNPEGSIPTPKDSDYYYQDGDYEGSDYGESDPYKDEEETVISTPNKCALLEENPLLFTPEEKAQLAQLLRKYYLIASTLKTEVDITMIYNEMDKYNSMIEQVKDLTNRCYEQTSSPSYDGPIKRSGNPWFKETEIKSYLTNESQTGSSYCTGKKHLVIGNGDIYIVNCKETNRSVSQKQCETINFDEELKTKCTWVQPIDKIDLEYEKILNVW